jgi:hypothetical protein
VSRAGVPPAIGAAALCGAPGATAHHVRRENLPAATGARNGRRKAGRPWLYLGHVNYRGRGNYHGRVSRRSQGQSCFRPCEPERRMPHSLKTGAMEPLLKGSQVRFGMGGIQEAAVDPVYFSRAPWAVTTVWLSTASIWGEEGFPQERTRGYRSDVANRLETQMKNRPFPAIADGTDV